MMRELRVRRAVLRTSDEEIGESAVLARSGSVQRIGTTHLNPPTPLVMLNRASIPAYVALADAGAGRWSCGGEHSAAKSATTPSLRATRVLRSSA
eukprot:5139387-Prymnesium_polylepis.1